MKALQGTSTRQPRAFPEVVSDLADFDVIAAHSPSHLFTRFASSFANVAALSESLKKIARTEFGYDVVLPQPPMAGADVAAGHHGAPKAVLDQRISEYAERLESSVRACPYFGRVEYLGRRAVRFSFCEASRETGLFKHTFTMTRKVHDLVNASERKLTDWNVSLPEKQQRLVRMLPSNVLPHVRVIIGTLVVVDESAAGTECKEHAFGRFLRGTDAAARQAIPSLATVTKRATAFGLLLAVAIADPALVIGDLVISGWLE